MARKCNDCEKQLSETADKPINCDLCDNWYGMVCSGIDIASYKVLTQKKMIMMVLCGYVCTAAKVCQASMNSWLECSGWRRGMKLYKGQFR